MFRKKKLYEIVWESVRTYTTIIEAKDEIQALKKLYRKYDYIIPSIISVKEYTLKTQNETLNGGN